MVWHKNSFPRVRGDVPHIEFVESLDWLFSPRTRGCSFRGVAWGCVQGVFPAYAGMFRLETVRDGCVYCFPRVRGDVPNTVTRHRYHTRFSPRTRGCSCWFLPAGSGPPVFPAYAGMFLTHSSDGGDEYCFPRVRGDVPPVLSNSCLTHRFSPRTRGCSFGQFAADQQLRVFPAYAGMFRRYRASESPRNRFPRVRGDVPPTPHRRVF